MRAMQDSKASRRLCGPGRMSGAGMWAKRNGISQTRDCAG